MQTSSQAVDAVLRGRPRDYVPLYDSPWGDTLRKWVLQGMPADDKGNAVDPIEHFGFDLAGCGGWWEWVAKRGQDQVLEETDEWKVVRNGNGAALKWWKNKSGTPEHIDFHMTTREVWEKEYRPHLLGFDPSRVNVQGARDALARWRAKGKWTYYGHMFIWEGMRASMGDVTMYTSLIEDPGWIHDFARVHTDLWKAAFKLLIEEAGRPDGVWIYEDLGYRDRLFCAPDVLRELIFPYYAEVVEFLHGYDLPVVLHSCGFQAPMIPLAIAAGFDGLNPMEVKAGNDIFAYAETYGDRIAFFGGFDARILESGDRPRIRREVERFIRGLKARNARFVFGSDHSLSTDIAYDAFRYALDVYREERLY
ncbi:MAG: Uroporphyrinogen decarboxylase (URO-D) [Lentisphaerae bacterium ADurb.BinA184]|nr:MAG: Uroporphyrinogen decarboxylase (URO-D) [Lentisphaerae bacterium ADurb.BinA184]